VALAYRRASATYTPDEEMQKLGTAAVHLLTIANSYMANQLRRRKAYSPQLQFVTEKLSSVFIHYHCSNGPGCDGDIRYATTGFSDRRANFRFDFTIGFKIGWVGTISAKESWAAGDGIGASAIVITSRLGTIVGKLVSYTIFSGHL
jgi:hypothetical protein